MVGERIRQVRRELGITQRELAARIGTEQTVISAYELGRCTVSLQRLQAIADALGVAPGDLLTAPTDRE